MKNCLRFPVLFCFFALLFLLSFPLGLQADETQALNTAIEAAIGNLQKTGGREITLKAAEEVVNGLGDPISASGSHVKGLYTPGKSDHDFTHRVASELSPEEALSSWQTARRRFSTEIKNETLRQFENQLRAELKQAGITDPAQIDRLINQARPQTNKLVQNEVVDGILQRTNLYPPDQVIGKVSGAEEAMKKYKKIKTVPRLSEEAGKELSDDVLKKATEGLYGPGAKAYRQGYESKAGVIWEIDPKTGKARKRLIDLTHMSEGYGAYTLEGMAGNSKQWGNKVKDALKEGDYRTAFKDLERLHLDMKKARDLASLPSPGLTGVEKFHNQYKEIKDAASKAFPADEAARAQYVRETIDKLFQENPGLKGEIESAVNTASKEADLLRIYGGELKANRKMFIRKMLDGSSEAGSRLRSALGDFYEKYGHHLNAVNFISAIFIYLDTAETASRAGQEDWDGAFRKGIETALGIPPALMPVGIMAVITNLIIDTAKDAGYSLAVASQDCEDLLAGIISVKGWEEAKSFGTKDETSIDEIARRLPLEAQVRNLVATLARNAATGQEGTQAINKGKEEALIGKCTGQVVAKWRKRRFELLSGYMDLQNKLNEEFNNLNVELSAEPNPARLKTLKGTGSGASAVEVVLQARAVSPIDPINQLLDQMREQIMILGGQQKLVILTLEQKTDWFKEGDSQPFAANKQFDRLKEVLDETRLVFNKPEKVKITCQIKWEIKVISAITDSADYTTSSFEIIGPILKGELPGFKSRLIPGDVVGTYKDQLGRTYDKKAEEFVSIVSGEEDDKDKPSGTDKEPTSPGGPSGPSEGKGESKDKPQTPTVITQPETYTKGQIGVGTSVEGQAGVSTGTAGQAGITGQPDTGKTQQTGEKGETGGSVKGDAGVSGDTQTKTTGQTDTGVKGETGLTSGQSGQTGISTKPPACTYQYSKWGECSRATKIWTRTVIGKEPAGCQETGKPVLEEVCTPPPTEEEKRLNYLNCLCRFSGGSLGGYYDPNNGKPCMAWGPLSGWGAGLPNDPKLVKSCLAGAYGKEPDDKDLKNSLDDIKKTNKKYIPPLKIKLSQEKCPIKAQLGDIITFTVTTEGGVPPYKYSWSGNGQAKENTFTFANARGPGSHTISVTVSDADGGSATASCTIDVEALVVKIELLDKENKIPIGESRNFRGTVMSGDKPAKGDFYFLWQPHPEIKFSPFEKTGGNISGTKATFNKLGTFKVWVIAHTYKGNVKTTIGESEQIEIEVSKPEIKLSYQPQNPKVGQEVKLTAREKPRMDDKAISFWWEISGSALNAGPLKNEREYTFRPKDTKPVTVTVHGKARDGGDDLGEDKAVITAQAYEVKLSEPQYMGSKPKIWKCDTQLGRAQNCGLVEVTKELAVFSDIFIKAAVTPQPEKTPLRYDWSVKPEGICGLPGAGQELKINCSQTGSYTVTVKVRDSQDVELGTASTQANITISQEELEKGKRHLVTLQADKTTLKTGETATIKANVQGGKSPYTFKWSEGLEGKGDSARFSPKKSGPQKISVEVTDGAGQKSSASLDLKVEAVKLEVVLKPDKPSGKIGDAVTLKAEVKGGEPNFTFKWSQGVEGKEESARFIPKKSGTQKISVDVSDGKGQKATASADIKAEAPKLEAALKTDKAAIKIGETANIKAEVKGGEPPLTYKWKEGVEGKEGSAQFTPKKSGPQKISLDITDAGGQKATANVDIKVEAPKLEVALKADKVTIKVGETAGIKAEVKGGEPVYKYVWGPGVEGKGETVRFTPKKSGTQKLSVEVEDSAKQKSTASLEVKVEAAKLEVSLTADKASLKAGETARLKAAVKGGSQPYEFTWSSQVEGKGETASFSPKEPGYFKIYVEVRDADRKKGVGNLDVTVQEGKGSTDSKTSGQKDSETKGEVISGKQVIEPDPLKLAPGESGVFRAFEVTKAGKKTELPPSKVSWKIEPYRGATIDRTGKVSVAKSAQTGTSIKVTALFEKSQTEGTLEIISAPVSTSATKESGVKEIPKTTKIIQPDPLQLSPGGSGLISLLEKDDQGRTFPLADPGKLNWKLESAVKDISLKPQKDGVAVVSAKKTARAGTKFRIVAGLEKSQFVGIVEIIAPSGLSTNKGKDAEKDEGKKSETTAPESKSTKVVKDTTPKVSTQGAYNPLDDAGLNTAKAPVDVTTADKFRDDFQQGQWSNQTKKTKTTEGSQQITQQPTDYTKSSDPITTKPPDPPVTTSQTQTPGGSVTDSGKSTSTGTTTKDKGSVGLSDVTVSSDSITVSVWDHGTVDGDIIDILLNGKVIPGGKNVTLAAKPKDFNLKLNPGKNTIAIYAVNEGTLAPNTASIKISNVVQGKSQQTYSINQKTSTAFGATVVMPGSGGSR